MRKLRFERAQLVHVAVVLSIRPDGLVEHVVKMLVMSQIFAQRSDASDGIGR